MFFTGVAVQSASTFSMIWSKHSLQRSKHVALSLASRTSHFTSPMQLISLVLVVRKYTSSSESHSFTWCTNVDLHTAAKWLYFLHLKQTLPKAGHRRIGCVPPQYLQFFIPLAFPALSVDLLLEKWMSSGFVSFFWFTKSRLSSNCWTNSWTCYTNNFPLAAWVLSRPSSCTFESSSPAAWPTNIISSVGSVDDFNWSKSQYCTPGLSRSMKCETDSSGCCRKRWNRVLSETMRLFLGFRCSWREDSIDEKVVFSSFEGATMRVSLWRAQMPHDAMKLSVMLYISVSLSPFHPLSRAIAMKARNRPLLDYPSAKNQFVATPLKCSSATIRSE